MSKQCWLLLTGLLLAFTTSFGQFAAPHPMEDGPKKEIAGSCDAAFQWTFTPNGCPEIKFSDLSTTSPDSLLSWLWTFGDGDSAMGPNPIHTYAANGAYTVCLTITTVDSCVSTVCDSVRITCINPITCQAGFTFDTTTPPAISFMDQSSASPGTIISWSWNFGDGGSSVQKNPIHYFAFSGEFITCLTISTDDNCTSTYCDTVEALIPTHLSDPALPDNFIRLYPIPADEQVEVSFLLPEATDLAFEVRNLQGQLVERRSSQPFASGKHALTWRLDTYPSGMYWLRIQSNSGTTVRKFLVR